MSKEQLEEINQRIVGMKRKSGMPTEVLTWSGWQSILPIFTKDLEYLQEQAERTDMLAHENMNIRKGYQERSKRSQELEILCEQLVGEEWMNDEGLYESEMMKLDKQNKKYRELIKGMGQEIEILTDVMSSAHNADELNEEVIRLKGALEESE